MNSALILNPSIISRNFSIPRILKVNPRVLLGLGIITVFSLLVFYIFQINSQAQEFHKLKDMEKNFMTISQEQKDLQIMYNNLGALDRTTSLVGKLNFEKVNKIHYIKILGNQIVVK